MLDPEVLPSFEPRLRTVSFRLQSTLHNSFSFDYMAVLRIYQRRFKKLNLGIPDMTNLEQPADNDDEVDGMLAYNPNRLLDTLIENLRLKNDAALSRALEVAPPVISKIRHHRLPVGASLLIRMHEVSDLSIRDLRYLMGDRRTKYRLSDKQGKPAAQD